MPDPRFYERVADAFDEIAEAAESLRRPPQRRRPVSGAGIALAVVVALALWALIVGGFYLLWLAVGL